MKRLIVNILATTGLSLVLTSLVAFMLGAKWLYLATILQILLLSSLIQLTILLRQKLEPRYFILDLLLDLTVIEGLIFFLALAFKWNQRKILLVLGLIIYVLSQVLDLFNLNQEVREINQLIKKRKD